MTNFWQDKQAIVTGGAGFIGSHLVDRLVKNGAGVMVIDDHSRGQNRSNRVYYSQHDLIESLPPYIDGDIIFHLAAKVTGIEYNRHNHYDMLMSNLLINANVVEAVMRNPPGLFVYVSTACVYPHDADVPTTENAARVCNPEPTNLGYGIAKWTGEQMTHFLHKEHGVNSLIVRFFNAFGERDYYDEGTSHVAPALIKRVVDGENPVVVWGTGTQTRVLVDAADIAKALMLLAEFAYHHKGPEPMIVNIGHSREVSIRDLAQTIIDLTGSKATLEFDTSKPDGYPRRAADTTLLRSLIGWEPDTPLEVTLEKMIREYESRRPDLR